MSGALSGRARLRERLAWLRARPGVLALVFFWLAAVWWGLLWSQGRPLGQLHGDGIQAITCSPAGAASVPEGVSCSAARRILGDLDPPRALDYVRAAGPCCLREVLLEQLWLDDFFPPLYVGFLWAAIVWLRRRLAADPLRGRPSARWLRGLGWLALAAAIVGGIADWFENLALRRLIDPGLGAELAWTPLYCRVKTVALFDVACGYLLVGWLGLLLLRWLASRATEAHSSEEAES